MSPVRRRRPRGRPVQVATDDQQETDRLWNTIVSNGCQESACNRCKDRRGLSWQITPRVLSEAMMGMGKIDIATTEMVDLVDTRRK